MPISFKRLSGALIFTMVFGALTTLSHAQQSATPAASKNSEAVQLSDEQLERYIAASRKIAIVVQEYQPQLEQAQDEAAREEVLQKADSEMVAAVQADGFSVEEYNGISLAIQQDNELRGRVEKMITQE